MSSRLALQPDLDEAMLEDRVLLAYNAGIPGTILTTGGYIVITTPPGLSSALNQPGGGGAPGGSGGNMATTFGVSGFGPNVISIGNVTGYSALGGAGRSGGLGTGANLNITVGSGANDPSGGQPRVSRNVVASGGSLGNGTNFLYIGQETIATSTPNTSGTNQNPNAGNGSGRSAPSDNTPPPAPVPPSNAPSHSPPGGVRIPDVPGIGALPEGGPTVVKF